MNKNKISIILTGYNEGMILYDNLKRLYDFLKNTKLNWELILYDDASRDDTLKIFKSFARNHKNVRVYWHDANIGRGGTVIDAVSVSTGDIVGYLDTDLELSPVFLPDFFDKIISGYDLVIGSRLYEVNGNNLLRAILSKGYTSLVRVLLNISYKDTEAGYKFFRKNKIEKVINKIKDKRWFFDTELVVRSKLSRLKIAEIPIIYIQRVDKKSSVRLFHDTLSYLYKLLKLSIEINKLK